MPEKGYGNGDDDSYGYDDYVTWSVFKEYKEHNLIVQDQCRNNILDQVSGLKTYFDKSFDSAKDERLRIIEINDLKIKNMIESMKLIGIGFSIIAAVFTIVNAYINIFL